MTSNEAVSRMSALEHLTIVPDSISVETANKVFDNPDIVKFLHENPDRWVNFHHGEASDVLARVMSETDTAMRKTERQFAQKCKVSQTEGSFLLPNLKSLHIGPVKTDDPQLLSISDGLHDGRWISPGRNNKESLFDLRPWADSSYNCASVYDLVKRRRGSNGVILSSLLKSVPSECAKTMRVPFGMTSLPIPHDADELINKHHVGIFAYEQDVDEFVDSHAYGRQTPALYQRFIVHYDMSDNDVCGRRRLESCRIVSSHSG